MNPVIGLDISKEESHGQAFLDRGKPYRGTFHFEHTRAGLEKLLQLFGTSSMCLDIVLR